MSRLPLFTPLSSSMLSGYHYDPTSQVLSVQFKDGGAYAYSGVKPQAAAAFKDAPSVGGHFAAHIKPKHRATRLS